MTTLADLQPGNQFMFACLVTALDPTTGLSLALYGPGRVLAATAAIAPSGAMSGTLAGVPGNIPINLVTGFAPLSVGDVMQNQVTGETMVCRWTQLDPDGSVSWSASTDHQVTYSGSGWSVIGHVEL